MSKIKANRIQGRTDSGTLTVGNDEGSVVLEGAVVIPGYVTEDRLDQIIAGDIDIDAYLKKEDAQTIYQNRGEKGEADGYPPLDSTGKIPTRFMNVSGIEFAGVYGTDHPLPDPTLTPDGISYICNTDNYTDPRLPGVVSLSGDMAIDTGDKYDHIPSTGDVLLDNTIESEDAAYVHHNLPYEADARLVIGNLQEQIVDLEDVYLPLSGGINHKMTGDLYMSKNQIQGVGDPVYAEDAANKRYVDLAIATAIDSILGRE
jgi:hypothetical protein